jgi:hypothetical protein
MSAKVFHGSEREFQSFDQERIGSMRCASSFCFWFSSKMEVAQDYGFLIYLCELSIKNPLRVSFEEFVDERQGPSYWAKKAYQKGFDGVILTGIVDCSYMIASDIYGVFNPNQIKILGVENQWEE